MTAADASRAMPRLDAGERVHRHEVAARARTIL
jgi:hypothetical protein